MAGVFKEAGWGRRSEIAGCQEATTQSRVEMSDAPQIDAAAFFRRLARVQAAWTVRVEARLAET